MVAHVVFFDIKPEIDAAGRQRFNDALLHALDAIPSVRACRIGRRVSIGARYESAGSYAYMAVIEFDDEAGLRMYLGHPAHAELGALFWRCSARTLVTDYELAGDDLARSMASWA